MNQFNIYGRKNTSILQSNSPVDVLNFETKISEPFANLYNYRNHILSASV